MALLHQVIAGQPSGDMAILRDGESISFGKLTAYANSAAVWLEAAGVTTGDTVAISVSDATLQLFLSLGLMQMGVLHTMLSSGMHTGAYRSFLSRMGVKFLLTDDQTISASGITTLLTPDIRSMRPCVRTVEPSRQLTDSEKVLLCHGSGTTGDPKIMAFTHKELIANCRNVADYFAVGPGDRTLILQRHTSLTYLTRAFQCLFQGGCLVEVTQMRLRARNYWELFCDAVTRYEVNHVHCTAFHAKALVEYAGTNGNGLLFPQLKTFLVGASPVSKILRERIIQRISPNLCINYGTNEGGSIARATPTLLERYPQTVGVATPLTEIAVLGVRGEPLEPGKEGMIAVRGPCVISGYEGDEAATRRVFRDGWFHTGDIGYITEDGAVHLLGRSDDMMIIQGTNVYPAEIEKVIDQLPQVKECAVVAVNPDLGRDLIVAFVVLRAPCLAEQIFSFCQASLGWKSPRFVFIVQSLPRNFSGKVLRRELVRLAQSRLQKSV